MLEMKKKYKWQEIVEEYPGKWVIISNVKEKAGKIKTCRLIEVCNYEEKGEIIRKYLEKGIKFECVRTTWRGFEEDALEEILRGDNFPDCTRFLRSIEMGI